MNAINPVERPSVATWLGYGGLIPFVAFAGLSFADPAHAVFWHENLRIYGGLILSFVGALHWGFAMLLTDIAPSRRNALMAWSVMPCLIALVSIVMHSDILLVIGFLVHYWRDRQLAATTDLPAWYLPLRLQLSAVAVLCIAAGAFAAHS